MENLNRHKASKEINDQKNFPQRKAQTPMASSVNLVLNIINTKSLINSFKREKVGTLPNLSYEISITLIPKLDETSQGTKTTDQ